MDLHDGGYAVGIVCMRNEMGGGRGWSKTVGGVDDRERAWVYPRVVRDLVLMLDSALGIWICEFKSII